MKRTISIILVCFLLLTLPSCGGDKRDKLTEEEKKEATEKYLLDMGELIDCLFKRSESITKAYTKVSTIYLESKTGIISAESALYVCDESGNLFSDPIDALKKYEQSSEFNLTKDTMKALTESDKALLNTLSSPTKELDDFDSFVKSVQKKQEEYIDQFVSGNFNADIVDSIPSILSEIQDQNEQLFDSYKKEVEKLME